MTLVESSIFLIICNQCVRECMFVYPQDGFKHKLLRNACLKRKSKEILQVVGFSSEKNIKKCYKITKNI